MFENFSYDQHFNDFIKIEKVLVKLWLVKVDTYDRLLKDDRNFFSNFKIFFINFLKFTNFFLLILSVTDSNNAVSFNKP
jgi:hypothetical protein